MKHVCYPANDSGWIETRHTIQIKKYIYITTKPTKQEKGKKGKDPFTKKDPVIIF